LDIVHHTGKLQTIEGIGNRLQVSVGQMQVDQSMFQARVSEPELDGAQVGSSVQQMGGATVAQTVGGQGFADAGLLVMGTSARLPLTVPGNR